MTAFPSLCVRRRGPIFVRLESFGATTYSPATDRFYALDPLALEALEKGHRHRGQGAKGRPRAPGLADLDSLVATSGHETNGPVMFGRPDCIDGPGGQPSMVMPAPPEPLLVNWLLTTECCYDCVYCCARDLRTNRGVSPDRHLVEAIAQRIRRSSCLAVVLTGGEPLLSPHLRRAIALLAGRKGVVLDTSGDGPLDAVIPSLLRANAHVRVSLDTVHPLINNQLRRPARNAGRDAQTAALHAIDTCTRAGIPVSVQTVISNRNKDPESLRRLLDLLCRQNVQKWNLYLMINAGAARDAKNGIIPDRRHALSAARQVQRLSGELRASGQAAPIVRIIDSQRPDSVILVSPEGVAFTESPDGHGKVRLGDVLNGYDAFTLANRSSHAWRYFGWIPGPGASIASIPLTALRGGRSIADRKRDQASPDRA